MLKNSSTLAVSVPINLSIKFGFVSVNCPRETYFVDALRIVSNYRGMVGRVPIFQTDGPGSTPVEVRNFDFYPVTGCLSSVFCPVLSLAVVLTFC